MAWTEFTRKRYERSGGRYASDASDAEWALIAPLMPARRRTGRPRTTDLRDVFDAILYIATTGCQWRLPRAIVLEPVANNSALLGPMAENGATAERLPAGLDGAALFYDWCSNGLLDDLNRRLVAAARQAEGRAPGPSAGVIDSQSVKTTESGGIRGYGEGGPWPLWGRVSRPNGKRIKGRKRHIVTDTLGLLVGLAVHGADVQDRDGAPDLLKSIAVTYPLLRHVFADGGYAGPKLKGALEKIGRWTVQIVKRSDTAQGFEVIPRRWVVERTLAWLGRCRRMAKDWEKTIASAQAWLLVAHIRRVMRLLAKA